MTQYALEGNPSVPEGIIGSTQTETPITQNEPTPAPAAPAAVETPTTPPATETSVETPAVVQPTEYEIAGIGKVTAEDVAQWRQGFMRQSDYTRKTQELAAQRQQTQDAIELFEYLRQNPALVEKLKEADASGVKADPQKLAATDPNYPMMQQIILNQVNMDIDRQLADIQKEYPTDYIDETLLFNTATQMGVKDLGFVYDALRGKGLVGQRQQAPVQQQQTPATNPLDVAAQQIRQEIQQNGVATHSIVGINQGTPPVTQVNTLSEDEARVAAGLGLTPEEYLKWR